MAGVSNAELAPSGMTVASCSTVMTMDLKVLKCGNCEPLKLGVHGVALGLAAVCGLYNAAAWLSRREQHLAVNTVLYMALIAFEQRHVAHHIAEMRQPKPTDAALLEPTPEVVVTAAPQAASDIAA
jgi:hypothetical protein